MLNETQKALGVMALTYGNFTKERAMAYYENLNDLPDLVVAKAIGSLIKTSRFAPSVADIREEAKMLVRKAAGFDDDGATKAWADVKDAISRVGGYRTPTFDDPATAEAVRRFGWLNLCMTPIDEIQVVRAQFMKFYNAVSKEMEDARKAKKAFKHFERIEPAAHRMKEIAEGKK